MREVSQDLQGAVFAPRLGLGGPHPRARPRGIGRPPLPGRGRGPRAGATYAPDDTGAVDFTVELMPDALSAALAAAATAREKAVRSPVQEMLTRRRLARQLYVEGLEVADIAAALGVSSPAGAAASSTSGASPTSG